MTLLLCVDDFAYTTYDVFSQSPIPSNDKCVVCVFLHDVMHAFRFITIHISSSSSSSSMSFGCAAGGQGFFIFSTPERRRFAFFRASTMSQRRHVKNYAIRHPFVCGFRSEDDAVVVAGFWLGSGFGAAGGKAAILTCLCRAAMFKYRVGYASKHLYTEYTSLSLSMCMDLYRKNFTENSGTRGASVGVQAPH